MNSKFLSSFSILLLSLTSLFVPAMSVAEDGEPKGAKDKVSTAIELLRKGLESGKLPDGMAIHVSADLTGVDAKEVEEAKANGIEIPLSFYEHWEFQGDQVKRYVKKELEDGDVEFKLDGSKKFDVSTVCKILLDGRAFEVQKGKGKGVRMQFVGTRFAGGHREISIIWNEESKLNLHECCLFPGYAESDAITFAELYAELAAIAREQFEK